MKKDSGVRTGGVQKPPQKPQKARKASFIPEKYWLAGLAGLVVISFVLRSFIPFKNVFIGDAVRFSSESDAWYHMMLAKTTEMFLERPWFDPLTNFPNGNSLHFGPFVSWGIAIISKIVGLGNPSMHTVDTVGAFWPAILGALLIIPVYYIGREIGGRGCGITAALLAAILPGQFFQRTTLGFTDHHSSEMLLSTTSMLLFILALRSGRDLSLSNVTRLALPAVKKPLMFAIAAGIVLGLYIDAWAMGILFEGILLIFLVLQSTIDLYRGRKAEYLGIIGAVGFFFALLMISPFAHSYNGFSVIQYSLFQPTMLILGIAFSVILAAVSKTVSDRGLGWYVHPASMVAVVVIGFMIMAAAASSFTSILVSSMFTYLLPRTGGAATVAELSPIYEHFGIETNFPGITFVQPFSVLLSSFFISIIGLFALTYRNRSGTRPGSTLVIVWSIVTLAITLAMNRSAYYYAVNVALLCGYLASVAYEFARFGELEDSVMRNRSSPENIVKDIKPMQILAIFAIIILLVIPSTFGQLGCLNMARYATGPNQDWFTSVTWLGNNTPSPGLDIYNVYKRPPTGQYFQYPETAYGVMSWWDYGHLIETIGHRYPNANPFQQGIGNKTAGTPGSSPFFLAESEDEAEGVLSELNQSRSPYLNARYIMTDVEMAVTKFHAIAAWSSVPLTRYNGYVYQQQGENSWMPVQVWMEPYYRTMVSRLQFFDGSETEGGDATAIAYQRVQQPDGARLTLLAKEPLISANRSELDNYVNESISEGLNASIVGTSFAKSPIRVEAMKHFRLVHESETMATSDGQRYVKTFENVPGATIKGKAAPGTTVIIATQVMTNQKRSFIYMQSNVTGSDGEFTLVVPYSTSGPVAGGTNFDTAPMGPYQLAVGDKVSSLDVAEEAVMSGGIITV